jgi:hypothetical protein
MGGMNRLWNLVRRTHSGLTTAISRASHRGWPQILGWLQAYVEGAV